MICVKQTKGAAQRLLLHRKQGHGTTTELRHTGHRARVATRVREPELEPSGAYLIKVDLTVAIGIEGAHRPCGHLFDLAIGGAERAQQLT